MAHSCPICDMLCHCGGDIDDCCFDGTEEQNRCNHCDEYSDDYYDDNYDEDDIEEWPADYTDNEPIQRKN